MDIRYRLAERRKALGLTMREVAEKCGVNEGTVSRWEAGQIDNMKRSNIVMLAKVLGISPMEILGREAAEHSDCISVPVLGKVAAGLPMTAVENIVGYAEVDPKKAAGSTLFALQIKGESMIPRIWDGDVVIVRKQPTAESGDIVIAQVGREEATCKKLRIVRDGIELHPFNPAYPVLYYSSDDIEVYPVEILGKVIESRRTY